MLARALLPLTLLALVACKDPVWETSLQIGPKGVLPDHRLSPTMNGKPQHDGTCIGNLPVKNLAKCVLFLEAIKVDVVNGNIDGPAQLELLEGEYYPFMEDVKVTWKPNRLLKPCLGCCEGLKVQFNYKCALERADGLGMADNDLDHESHGQNREPNFPNFPNFPSFP